MGILMQDGEQPNYQVLARKYRPSNFEGLIGQDPLVRTLSNAFAHDRIAHAFVMTGVRGVGKTTTARIIAKGLNCTGEDGTGGPTTKPCDLCASCRAITEGRSVDVIEMDAASRTGVNDIREIIDSVQYRAASSRFKVYIIDEVHMLSTSAFNALLKTLEEPPAHVKFIFATTEIRKIPVTVLSRCQRFDLRRIEPEVMQDFLSDVVAKEKAEIDAVALGLITRAAEGSVRDALSLLDQAISHSNAKITGDAVRDMLGLANRSGVMDLFERIMKGDAPGALEELSAQFLAGTDPLSVLKDLAEVTHWISMVKIEPASADDPTIPPDVRDRGKSTARELPMRALIRAWQMLLKSLEETKNAPSPMMAVEMAIIRLTHVADLPSPDELIRKIEAQQSTQNPTTPQTPNAETGQGGLTPQAGGEGTAISVSDPSAPQTPRSPTEGPTAQHHAGNLAPKLANDEEPLSRFVSFETVLRLIRARRDIKLLVDVEAHVGLAAYRPGVIEFEPKDGAPKDLSNRLAARLSEWTGVRWAVSVVTEGGAPTIKSTREEQRNQDLELAKAHNLVQTALSIFPEAKILRVERHAPSPEDDAMLADVEEDDTDDLDVVE